MPGEPASNLLVSLVSCFYLKKVKLIIDTAFRLQSFHEMPELGQLQPLSCFQVPPR